MVKKTEIKVMQVINFNDNWIYYGVNNPQEKRAVTLPHDATFYETRSPKNPSSRHGCWFKGCDYVYEKKFTRPQNGSVYFEFESVYRDAEVYINGRLAFKHDYGYGCFSFCADEFLVDGENVISVTAKNELQPNSRWYSGGGIIRPVKMYLLPEKHVMLNGVKISTLDHATRALKAVITTNCVGEVRISALDGDKVIYDANSATEGVCEFTFNLPNATLWSDKTPKLYGLKVCFNKDERIVPFGIRTVTVDSKNGLLINGERVILKGACVHHDNGLLGGAGHPFADYRKVKLLKDAGYNALRSAHNPISKEMMRACDELGLYILDEVYDGWYIHKTRYDYADKFDKNKFLDIDEMIEKDYNGTSVIMYSLGNEVSETATNRGIDICKELTEYIHKKDYRPVTCGINVFFNYLSSLGFGVYTDKKAQSENEKIGSEFYNNLTGILGDSFMKFGATLGGSDRKTRGAFANLDVAGYNYGILRYKKDVKKYPDRVILGTETFCKDAVKFMDLAKKYPAVIGDFVWAGMDYLGEVGAGSWVYKPYTETFSPSCGWMTAGSGRIDIIGDVGGEALYTKVAFGDSPLEFAVVPADKCFEKHSPSAWKTSNAIESWSFDGCAGKKTIVEVYSVAHKVSLCVNGKKTIIKRTKKGGITKFKVKYFEGEIIAKALDKNGKIIAKRSLKTANAQTKLSLIPETEKVKTDGLAYVKIRFTDTDGVLKPLINDKVSLNVTGGELLGYGNACPFNKEGYHEKEAVTYYGSALAIIKPTDSEIIINARANKLGFTDTVKITVDKL